MPIAESLIRKLFNPDDNPLYSSAPQDPTQTAPQPSVAAPDPGAAPPRGLISSAMAPPESRDQYLSEHPPAIAARPTGDFDTGAHPALRHALASLFAGMSEFGRPGSGFAMADRWAGQEQAKREYDRNLPTMTQEAGNRAYDTYLGEQGRKSTIGEQGAETGKIGQETENLKLNPPGKADFLKEFQTKLESGEEDPQSLLNSYLPRAGYAHVTREELVNLANSTKIKAPVFKIGPQGIREPIRYMGKNWTGDEADAPQEVKDAAKNAGTVETKVHSNKLQEQGAAASRLTMSSDLHEKTANAEKGREQATKHLGDMRAAQNQQELVENLASSKSPTDQTSLAFKALGLDLPEGVHRINETELNAIRSQGSLSDRAYRAILNWKTGQQFAPEILEDIKATARKISASKIKNANDNLEDVNRVYGYKAPGSDDRGRFDTQLKSGDQGGGGQKQMTVGQDVTIKGKPMKVTAVHPDGSFDAK